MISFRKLKKTHRVNVVHVEAIAELDDARSDLVKEDILFAAVYMEKKKS